MAKCSDWSLLHARVHRILRSRCLLPRHQRILVAVSGGQDSLCLAKLLLDLQPKWEWQLGIAHCNHQWRSDAAANATYVSQLAQLWNIPFYSKTTERGLHSEAAAREWRYQTLSVIAQENNYNHVVTGHTASDRAETLLYNLIRGSGADGLQALTWHRPLTAEIILVRPLLEVTRTETATFCQEMQLKVWEDSTNQDLKYARNRIRQELLPYLYQFNPKVEQNLAQTAEILQAEVEYLESVAQQLQQNATVTTNEATIQLNCLVLRTAPLALQRRVIRRVLQQTLQSAASFEHIEKVVALIAASNGSQSDPLPGGAIAQVKNGGLWIHRNLTP
ncbi:tRNA lysidine(34) synthetase TilS [Gloeocapsopsis dulcis]|uniref:tRNA(Ile)-lysidine synthase n=1 Tax=Gloeocapsopsis dulcis AAB1 = 1H9 TaxID=1433147 RepID=A0A6N8FWC8_9CHRO|nr:tRNA lysidine(34) synthetase TilS [Gloeocapsopsis dulcis]MUL37430.1 tRNA lysidine(34) synthetase TilS [Gloeocapsopsis dulcis AAB1 = 1H9]WNN87404.1 tRNA lysidine(34) synthetase TilS [Gloeocapsopsis dulcis]